MTTEEKVKYWVEIADYEKVFISEMIPMNIEARYPQYKDELSKTLSQERCALIINNTKEFQAWIKKML